MSVAVSDHQIFGGRVTPLLYYSFKHPAVGLSKPHLALNQNQLEILFDPELRNLMPLNVSRAVGDHSERIASVQALDHGKRVREEFECRLPLHVIGLTELYGSRFIKSPHSLQRAAHEFGAGSVAVLQVLGVPMGLGERFYKFAKGFGPVPPKLGSLFGVVKKHLDRLRHSCFRGVPVAAQGVVQVKKNNLHRVKGRNQTHRTIMTKVPRIVCAAGILLASCARSSVDRASACGAEGRRFESSRARHSPRNPLLNRSAGVLILILGATISHATPEHLKVFSEAYPQIAKPDCTVCHVKPPVRNAYGKLIEDELLKQKQALLSREILATVNATKNPSGETLEAVIKAGQLPAPKLAEAGTPAETKPAAPKSPIPTHAFHPAMVHFPLALILFAFGLEVFSRWKKKDEYRDFGFVTLLVGLITSVPAIGSGLLAANLKGYGLFGAALTHSSTAMLGIFVASVAAYVKVKGHGKAPAYVILLALASALIGLAGHLGGELVFGPSF